MFQKKGENSLNPVVGKEKKKLSKKTRNRIIVLVIVLVLVITMMIRCSAGANQAMTVETVKVKKGNVSAELATSGTIKSEETKVYASPVSAAIADVGVQVGDEVAQGDYLITYNTDSVQEKYDLAALEAKATEATQNGSVAKSNQNSKDKADADASIADLKTQIENKTAELNAATSALAGCQQQANSIAAQAQQYTGKTAAGTLTDEEKAAAQQIQDMNTSISNEVIAQQNNVSTKQTELSDLQSKLAEAQSKKASAEAGILTKQEQQNLNYNSQKTELSVTSAGNDLSKAQAGITAEFNGVVTDVQAVSGAVAQEGQSMVTVADSSNMKVEFKVSKYSLESLSVGQTATINFLNHEYTGSVTSISHVATMGDATSTNSKTPTAAMVTAVVHIDNPDNNLVIGLDAKVKIKLGSKENVLVVPLAAVNTNKTGDFVYVVQNGVVEKREIETGLTSDDTVEIFSGLKEGETVITSIDSTIEEGMTVVPVPAKEETDKLTTASKETAKSETATEMNTETVTESTEMTN